MNHSSAINPDVNAKVQRDPSCDSDWADLRANWEIRSDTVYLNHGSFGPPPKPVRKLRQSMIDALDEQPMDFYLRQFEPLLEQSKKRLAAFLGTAADNLVFAENATYGMNVVADSFSLQAGDEILLNNHEYGAVHRIWERVAERTGAKYVTARLPDPIESKEQVIDSLLACCSDRTKLLVISHVTSATALIMPVAEICESMRQRGIAVCVDGPHAPAQVDFQLDDLGCDFYTASCHKWLNASLGTGFLYVNPKWQEIAKPQIQSWGRLLPAIPEHWTEEFTWIGTCDPSGYLSMPAAIDFLEAIGLETFRARTRWLATYAEEKMVALFGNKTIAERAEGWYGSMAHVRLPPSKTQSDHSQLQTKLWEQYKIEAPMYGFDDQEYLRVSCHLYNSTQDIDQLMEALRKLI